MPLSFIAILLSQTQVSLVFGGDVIPHDPVRWAAQTHAQTGEQENFAGWTQVLGPLQSVFRRSDLAIVNLESPVVELKKPETGPMVFHAPPILPQALKALGVDIATFANNHCLDQHPVGIASTRNFLREAQLQSVGADLDEAKAWTPLSLEVNGKRLGFLAFTRFLNGFHNPKDLSAPQVPLVPYATDKTSGGMSEKHLLDVVKSTASQFDLLVVIPHWGDEYQTTPKPEDRALAQKLVDAGAGLIVGHHPHVVQPVEWFRRSDAQLVPVAFSLGNLISNQDSSAPLSLKRDGLLLEVTAVFSKTGHHFELNGIPTYTENQLEAKGKRNIQAVLVDDEVTRLQAALEVMPAGSKQSVSLRTVIAARLKRLQLSGLRTRGKLPVELTSQHRADIVLAEPTPLAP